MAQVRVGIVGSRFAARLHLRAYRRVYGVDVRLAGVTSPTAERREAFARESGATPYPDLDALLPHVDVVDVCSPPATHEALALRAIEAGKHVVIEKPFTGAFGPASGSFAGHRAGKETLRRDALASADRIVEAARRRGVVLAYAENWIYAPAVQKEREIIEIQEFMECCVSGRRPQSDAELAHDTVATLYAGYVSAERRGEDVPVPMAGGTGLGTSPSDRE